MIAAPWFGIERAGLRGTFFVPGRARSTQTGSVVRPGQGRRAVPIRMNPEWSTKAGLMARMSGPPRAALAEPVIVSMLFLFDPPDRRRREAMPFPTKGDLDNLAKGLLDAFQGVLYVKDQQIVRLDLGRRWCGPGEAQGVRVWVHDAADVGPV